jgi:DNA-binding response OmpR family regulator
MTKRVFLMDDSAFALELTRTALVETGIEVQCGRDLADLKGLDAETLDLVLMDVDMPEAFGDDVVAFLIGEGLATPVYLLSGLPADQLARRAADAGAAGYIEKRRGVDHVIAEVQRILGLHGTCRSLAPTILLEDFLSSAEGRMRRVESAVQRGEASHAASELHTLSGEASLVGLADVARHAEEGYIAAISTTGGAPLAIAAACAAPLKALAVALTGAAERARLPPRTRTRRDSGARLLLLDDSDFYRSTLMALLEDAGYEVVEARRLAEARHRIRDGRYDLAILDLHLDDGHGSELIPELRAHAPKTRLVLLSGEDTQVPEADLVLSKTLETGELLRRIGELAAPA